MSVDDVLSSFDQPMGLLPLPNVVLLPEATLPLQILEPRYRAMVRDALSDDALIALALLQPGFEPSYYTNMADIYPTVCVGRIREYVQIQDGRYFVSLFGLCRARVQEEDRHGEYRLAVLEPMVSPDTGVDADGEYAARGRCQQILSAQEFESFEGISHLRAFVHGGTSLAKIVDKLAAHLLPMEAFEIKQRLLEEPDVLQRAETLVRELKMIQQALETRQNSLEQWPHFGSMN